MTKFYNINYRKLKTEINIIPLLDILLVLVTMLIITSTNIFQKIDVNLPKTKNFTTVSAINDSTAILEIIDIGKYRIVLKNMYINGISPKNIISKIQYNLKINNKIVFWIASTKNIPYSEIIVVLNFLRQAGVKSIGLMTNQI